MRHNRKATKNNHKDNNDNKKAIHRDDHHQKKIPFCLSVLSCFHCF